MNQELFQLRLCILEGRYQDALAIIDQLEWVGNQQILLTIENFLVRLLIHLVKNYVEEKLTNAWAAGILDSVIKIYKLNMKDNKSSFYINQNDWKIYLTDVFEDAVFAASVEVANGAYKPHQLRDILHKDQIINIAHNFLSLTYVYTKDALRDAIYEELIKLPGGDAWSG